MDIYSQEDLLRDNQLKTYFPNLGDTEIRSEQRSQRWRLLT